jgi:hypothetical protein
MKKIIILFSVVSVILTACQKEIDWGTGNPDSSPVLFRIKSKTGASDTTQTDFYYDANKRLIRELVNGIASGQDMNNELTITRNGAGIITKTVQKAAALQAAGIDSVVTFYNYNTGTSKYTSSVFQLGIPGFTVMDSAVYTYDGAGRISKDEHYMQILGLPIPIPPILAARNTYTYSADGKNLVAIATDAATAPGGPLTPATAQAYTFDSKVNALILLNEAVLLNRHGFYNANNGTKVVLTNTIDPSQDFTMDITYTYNSTNKPDSSNSTRTPGGAVTTSKYFYQ